MRKGIAVYVINGKAMLKYTIRRKVMKKMMLVIATLLLSSQMTFANVTLRDVTLTDVEGHWAEDYITDWVKKMLYQVMAMAALNRL